jgi:hypothetical protein
MKAVVAILFLVPAFAAVDGTVINRTTGKPQAGASVALYKLGQSGMEWVASVKSGADGKFTLDQSVQGPHLIQTAFDGVTYNHILPPGSATTGLTLDVYKSSNQPGAASLFRHFLILEPKGDQLSVDEGFVFHNDGLITYNDPDSGTLKFYLPAAANGAVQVKATAPQGMPIGAPTSKTNQSDVYKVDFPIKPGETNFQVTYSIPYTSGSTYEGKVLHETKEPTFLVAPPGVTLKGEGIETRGQEPQSQAMVYTVQAPAFKFEISGVATPSADADTGDNGPGIEEVMPKVWGNMKWILALALGILALGFILLYRAQPAAAPDTVAAGGQRASRRG